MHSLLLNLPQRFLKNPYSYKINEGVYCLKKLPRQTNHLCFLDRAILSIRLLDSIPKTSKPLFASAIECSPVLEATSSIFFAFSFVNKAIRSGISWESLFCQLISVSYLFANQS